MKQEYLLDSWTVRELVDVLEWQGTLELHNYGILIDGRLVAEAIKQLKNIKLELDIKERELKAMKVASCYCLTCKRKCKGCQYYDPKGEDGDV